MLRATAPMRPELGARYRGNGNCHFQVWAPLAEKVELHLTGSSSPETYIPMKPADSGYHEVMAENIFPGSDYLYRLDGTSELADPASHFQPQGVPGPSQVVDPNFAWGDEGWSGLPLQSYIIYEVHVGTFTRASGIGHHRY
jgi:maltooligosyltrehalose trehalohydrolase